MKKKIKKILISIPYSFKLVRLVSHIYNSILFIPFVIFNFIYAPFFLLYFNSIFKNNHILVSWHPSFGHQIMGIDYIRRLVSPYKCSVIEILSKNNNMYLKECFNNECVFYSYPFKGKKYSFFFSKLSYSIVRFYISLIISILSLKNIFYFPFKIQNLYDFNSIYDFLTLSNKELLIVDDVDNQRLNKFDDTTGYSFLVNNKIGSNASLDKDFKKKSIEIIKKKINNFEDKKIFTLCLRKKGENTNYFSNKIRNPDNQKNYIPLVNHICEKSSDNIVFIIGDYEKIFNDCNNCFYLDQFENKDLINVFLINECNYFISQQSGPLVLAESSNRNVLILDNMYHSISTFNQKTFICNKKLFLNQKRISNYDIYTKYINYSLGQNLYDLDVKSLHSDELIKAFEIFYNKDFSKTLSKDIFKNKSMRISHSYNHIIDI